MTLKVVSESRVTWATSVPILVFLGLSVLELGPMYATDRRQPKASLNASAHLGRGIKTMQCTCIQEVRAQHVGDAQSASLLVLNQWVV